LIESGKVTELVTEEFSRLGRNTADVINVLSWLEENEINVSVKNLGLQSRPNGKKNPIWNMVSSIMSSLYELELQNIKERTEMGRIAYLHKGGKLGRPEGTNESDALFLKKESSQKVLKALRKGLPIREVSKIAEVSTKTVMKVKKIAGKYSEMSN
jgi:DNA invertase Pin-like site-specific DNA recombinase